MRQESYIHIGNALYRAYHMKTEEINTSDFLKSAYSGKANIPIVRRVIAEFSAHEYRDFRMLFFNQTMGKETKFDSYIVHPVNAHYLFGCLVTNIDDANRTITIEYEYSIITDITPEMEDQLHNMRGKFLGDNLGIL